MCARLGKRPDVIAHLAAMTDVDQLPGRLALLALQPVLIGDILEVVDDAVTQLGAVARLEH